MLARLYRFHGHSSLNFLYKRGTTTRAAMFALRAVENRQRNTARVAVVVSRKVSKSAVVRNRIRRRLYESVRPRLERLAGYDLVFLVYDEKLEAISSTDLDKQVERLLHNATRQKAPNPHAIVEGKE